MNQKPREPELVPRRAALRLALTYGVVGTAWILFSDYLLVVIPMPIRVERQLAATKGTLFVLVTSLALYAVSQRLFGRIHRAQDALKEQEGTIRQAYVDVLDAVTGGRLVLVTEQEMEASLGMPLTDPHRLTSPSQLSSARKDIANAAERASLEMPVAEVLSAVGEALNNALKHAGSGEYQTLVREDVLQVRVKDQGPGIDFRTLPKATLLPGFSTAQTLGMGFTIMLQICERVLICTEPGSTSVVLEVRGGAA